jgi:hypothetical protein
MLRRLRFEMIERHLRHSAESFGLGLGANVGDRDALDRPSDVEWARQELLKLTVNSDEGVRDEAAKILATLELLHPYSGAGTGAALKKGEVEFGMGQRRSEGAVSLRLVRAGRKAFPLWIRRLYASAASSRRINVSPMLRISPFERIVVYCGRVGRRLLR